MFLLFISLLINHQIFAPGRKKSDYLNSVSSKSLLLANIPKNIRRKPLEIKDLEPDFLVQLFLKRCAYFPERQIESFPTLSFATELNKFHPRIFHKSFRFELIDSREKFFDALKLLEIHESGVLYKTYSDFYFNKLVALGGTDPNKLLRQFINGSQLKFFIAYVNNIPSGFCSLFLTMYGVAELFDVFIEPSFLNSILRKHIYEEACEYAKKKFNFSIVITSFLKQPSNCPWFKSLPQN